MDGSRTDGRFGLGNVQGGTLVGECARPPACGEAAGMNVSLGAYSGWADKEGKFGILPLVAGGVVGAKG